MTPLEQAREDYKGVLLILGALAAAPPVISMIQHIFAISLYAHFSSFVVFYRALVAPIFHYLHIPIRMIVEWLSLDWTIPQWIRDLHTLSFVGAGLYARGAVIARPRSVLNVTLVALLVGAAGLGLIAYWWIGRAFFVRRRVDRAMLESEIENLREKIRKRAKGKARGSMAKNTIWLYRSEISKREEVIVEHLRSRGIRIAALVTMTAVLTFYLGNGITPLLR